MALRADDVDLGRDRDLVVRSQSGDDGAFEDLYRRYFGRLYRFCLRRIGDPHEAEELAQEAFARAYGALPRLDGERRFYPWLSVIASRLCVDAFRRRARSEPSAVVDLGAAEGGQERVLQAVDAELLLAAMGRLAPRHREALALREHEGWSYQHIADHYDVSLGTVEALLHRARKALRREFDSLAGGDARRAAGLPVLGALARWADRVRSRVAGWEVAWTPVIGNAMAAAVVVAGSAVGSPAVSGAPPVHLPTTPVVAVSEPTTAPAPAPAQARATGAGGPVPSDSPAPTGPPPTTSPPGPPDGRLPLGGEVVHGASGRQRTAEQPTGNDTGGVSYGVDPASIAKETLATVDDRIDDFREES